MREYDVPFAWRFAIDCDVRAGHWFNVRAKDGMVSLHRRADLLQRAEPVICAFDIECTKLPLQFPNAEHDQVRLKQVTLCHCTVAGCWLGSYGHYSHLHASCTDTPLFTTSYT